MQEKKQDWKQLRLVVIERNKRKAEYKLDRSTIGIGHSNMNQVVLRNRGVSPFHARVTLEGEKCIIRNLGAHEGVRVNGEKIDRKIIFPGDEIQIGRVHLKVEEDIPGKKVIPRKEEAPRKKHRRKIKFHIPVRLVIILIVTFIVILILDIHWLIQILNWK